MRRIIISLGLIMVLVLPASGCKGSSLGGAYENPATIEGNIQTVATTFLANSYAPITVQVGIPVKWTILIREENLNSCNNEILIPEYDIDKKLTAGENIVEFIPTKVGTFSYSCWMGMIYSRITVVENLSNGSTSDLDSGSPNNQTVTPRTVLVATVSGGQATVQIKIGEVGYGYSPNVVIVQKDVPTDFVFTIINPSCATDVVFPQMRKSIDLTKNNIVTVTPQKDFTIECSMQMYGFFVLVVDDVKGSEVDRLLRDIENNPAKYMYFNADGDCGC
ncbi:MAG: hypothetical protein FWD43_00830 [Coriobacteriia bacterium]|nr:hypothetical protein [Coriobacteriia bacterium]